MNSEMKQRIIQAIETTYIVIIGDLESANFEDNDLGLDDVIESVLDANRVNSHGQDDEAANVLYSLKYNEMYELSFNALHKYY